MSGEFKPVQIPEDLADYILQRRRRINTRYHRIKSHPEAEAFLLSSERTQMLVDRINALNQPPVYMKEDERNSYMGQLATQYGITVEQMKAIYQEAAAILRELRVNQSRPETLGKLADIEVTSFRDESLEINRFRIE